MRAAIYVARHPGEGFEGEVEKANAFCRRQGLEPIRLYHSDFLLNKGKVADFLAAARLGVFEVVLGPFPDCFPTRFLKQLVAAGVGFACYNMPESRS